MEQLAANPEIKQVMRETKAGGNISQAAQKEAVLNNLANIAASDSDNVMAVWISDLDASSFLQSDGLTNEEDWDITGRSWYSCIETKQTILTEPYVDSTNGKMVLSAAAPVYDDVTGDILGAVGMDITLDQMTKLMSEYKIGRKGYILLLSGDGMIVYHPQNDMIQQNIKDINISENAVKAAASSKNVFLGFKTDGTFRRQPVTAPPLSRQCIQYIPSDG